MVKWSSEASIELNTHQPGFPLQVSGLLNAPKISRADILHTKMTILNFFVLIQRKLPNLAFPGVIFGLLIQNVEISQSENLITPKMGLLNAH